MTESNEHQNRQWLCVDVTDGTVYVADEDGKIVETFGRLPHDQEQAEKDAEVLAAQSGWLVSAEWHAVADVTACLVVRS